MSKHTPGPWVVRYDYVVQAPAYDDGRLVPVAQPYGVNCDGTDLFANARLIAAAPDYHEAVQAIFEACESNAAPVNLMAALRELDRQGKRISLDADLLIVLFEAHAKATGEA